MYIPLIINLVWFPNPSCMGRVGRFTCMYIFMINLPSCMGGVGRVGSVHFYDEPPFLYGRGEKGKGRKVK